MRCRRPCGSPLDGERSAGTEPVRARSFPTDNAVRSPAVLDLGREACRGPAWAGRRSPAPGLRSSVGAGDDTPGDRRRQSLGPPGTARKQKAAAGLGHSLAAALGISTNLDPYRLSLLPSRCTGRGAIEPEPRVGSKPAPDPGQIRPDPVRASMPPGTDLFFLCGRGRLPRKRSGPRYESIKKWGRFLWTRPMRSPVVSRSPWWSGRTPKYDESAGSSTLAFGLFRFFPAGLGVVLR